MKVWAISDLHLSLNNPKPMDIFGPAWDNYVDKIFDDWKEKVGEEDIVLLAGDFSWAMNLNETRADFDLMKDLPGKKIIIRGNHDYWWKSISGVREFIPEGFYAIQNDALKFGNFVVCGTRLWQVPENDNEMTPENKKIFDREAIRLELTLQAGEKLKTEQDKLICMLHYPPINFKRQDSAYSLLLEKYHVDDVVFGHLHGYKNVKKSFVRNGINYYLTSCDIVENQLVLIAEDWFTVDFYAVFKQICFIICLLIIYKVNI